MFIKILFLFMTYAIIGWVWETPYVSIGQKKYINRGFLRGPYIPIYGLACITIILTMSVFQDFNQDRIGVILIQVMFISLVSAVWEYVTSWSLEVVFKTRWWDYSKHKFNLNGRIALDYTILFGIGGYILWRFINPLFLELYSNISGNLLVWIVTVFYLIFFIDSYLTLRDLFNLRSIVIKLNTLKVELGIRQDMLIEKVHHHREFSRDYIADLVASLQELKERGKERLSESLEMQISNVQLAFKNSSNLSRLFKKFPKSPFRYWNDIREKIGRRK